MPPGSGTLALLVFSQGAVQQKLLASIRSPLLQRLVSYWFERRGGAPVTPRREIGPADFPALLPHVFLYDYDPAIRGLTLRLAGEEIRRILPNSLPGTPIEQIIPAVSLDSVLGRYRRVCEEPAILHATGRVFLNLGGTGVGERVCLPLAGADGSVRQMIGATIYNLGDHLHDGSTFAREEVAITFTPL